MIKRALAVALSLSSVLGWAGAASAADYGAKGPLATTTTSLSAGFGGATGGKLVVPNDAGKYPLVIASHGWSASSANQVGWAEHFASWGFVVVAPDFPSPFMPDAAKNRDIILAIAKASISDKADLGRIGLEGHSAGALATTLAAVSLKPRATVLFDPVDRDGLGKTAHATLCTPVLSIFANGSSCNNNAGWFAFRTEPKGPLASFRVKGSTHCDGENADRGVACASFCGGAADKGRQAIYARYATAMLLARLRDDAEAAASLAAGTLSADPGLEAVVVQAGPDCAAPSPMDAGGVDAGGEDASSDDAAVVDDARATSDATPVEDAPGGADATSTESAGGCSCVVGRASRSPGASMFYVLALLLVSRKRTSAAGRR